MKRIRLEHSPEDYPADVDRILLALAHHGYLATRQECVALWQQYSDSMCAGWMMLPDSEAEIVSCVRGYFDVDDNRHDDDDY